MFYHCFVIVLLFLSMFLVGAGILLMEDIETGNRVDEHQSSDINPGWGGQTDTYTLYETCITKGYVAWRDGKGCGGWKRVYYHEDAFQNNFFSSPFKEKIEEKWRLIILGLWKDPSYKGYIRQKGINLAKKKRQSE
eukprot:474458_1